MNSKKILSLSIASILFAGASIAHADTSKDESEDSVNSWGPWGGVQTAAGPTNFSIPLIFPTTNANNAPRSEGTEPQVTQEGYRSYASWGAGSYDTYGTSRAQLTHNASFIDGSEGQQNYFMGPATGTVNVTNEEGGSVSFTVQHAKNHGYQTWYGGPTGSLHVNSDSQQDHEYGNWYASGTPALRGAYFNGVTSSLAAINALANTAIQGNGTANYSGNFIKHGIGKGVNITVSFGQNASWRGDFNSKIGTFSVENGSINGVDLQGAVNTPSVGGSPIVGSVDASFFGSNAGTIGGIADVAKGETKFVEVFKADFGIDG